MVKRLAVLYMKTGFAVFLIFVLAVIPYVFFQNDNLFPKFVGMVTQGFDNPSEEQQCMVTCASIGCEISDQTCLMNHSKRCFTECGLKGEIENYSFEDLFGSSSSWK